MSAPEPVDTEDWLRRTSKRLAFLETRGGAERIPFPFVTGWDEYDSGGTTYEVCEARRESGLIRCFGLSTRAGALIAPTTSPQLIAILPVGFRPGRQAVRYGVAGSTSVGYVSMRFDIFPSGNVTVQHLTAASYVAGYFQDLSPIVFTASG